MAQRRVLVVESETGFANRLRQSLSVQDFEVQIIGDGGQALETARSQPVDLILLCVELPNMSGYSICNKLKKHPELRDIPLIIMSADATQDIFEQHRKLKTRADDYLIKPFPMDELLEKIDRLIGPGDVAFPTPEPGRHFGGDLPSVGEMAAGYDGNGRGDEEIAISVEDDLEDVVEEFEIEDDYIVSGDEQHTMVDTLAVDGGGARDVSGYGSHGADDPEFDAILNASTRDALGDSAKRARDDYDDLPPATSPERGGRPRKGTGEDDEIAMATDAAFAALQIPGEARGTVGRPASLEILLPSEAAHEEGMRTFGEPVTAPVVTPLEMDASSVPGEGATAIVTDDVRSQLLAQAGGRGAGAGSPSRRGRTELGVSARSPVDEEHALAGARSHAAPSDNGDGDRLEMESLALAAQLPGRGGFGISETEAVAVARVKELELEAMRSRDEHERETRRLRDDSVQAVERLKREHTEETKRQQEALRKLEQKLEQAQAQQGSGERAAAAGTSRDRELLSLRETINRKEKEVLDLRDDVDAKERQILDHKDKVRELERRQRDIDEKMITMEREAITTRERAAALEQDKEQLVQREQGVKARLQQAKQEIDKAYAENTALKAKLSEELEQARAAQQAREEELAAELASEKRASADELNRVAREHEQALAEQAAMHEQALNARDAEHTAALREASVRYAAERAELEERHRAERDQQATAHAAAQEALRSENEQAMEELREQTDAALYEHQQAQQQALERAREEGETLAAEREAAARAAGEAELARQREAQQRAEQQLRGKHQDEIEELKRKQQSALEQKDADAAASREALRGEHRTTSERLAREHEYALAALEQRLSDELEATRQANGEREAGLSQALDDARQRVSELETQLRHGQTALEISESRVSELEGELSEMTAKEAQGRAALGEQQAQTAALEDRLMSVLDKVRADEALAEKAKRAMAVAIALLEEQKKLSVNPAAREPSPDASANAASARTSV